MGGAGNVAELNFGGDAVGTDGQRKGRLEQGLVLVPVGKTVDIEPGEPDSSASTCVMIECS